jgi:bacillithiol system protein YtxJ
MAEASKQAARFVPVDDASALDGLFALSEERPVLLFKHSTTCPISAHAHREMSRLDAGAAQSVSLVVVQTARPVSNEIAARTGVRHESPQAILLRRGKPVWTASHYDITAAEVERAVRENE